MRKMLFCLFLLLTASGVRSQNRVDLELFNRYIIDNYVLPDSLRGDCHYHYMAMVLESNNEGEITKIRYLNEAHPALKESFGFVKRFRFDASMNVKMRPILVIGTIDQQDRNRCPYLYQFDVDHPNWVTANVVKIMKEQLKRDPQTVLMDVLRFVDAAPSHAPAPHRPATL